MNTSELCPFCIDNNLLRVNVLYEDDLWYVTDTLRKYSLDSYTESMDHANLTAAMHLADRVGTSTTSDRERIQFFATLQHTAKNS